MKASLEGKKIPSQANFQHHLLKQRRDVARSEIILKNNEILSTFEGRGCSENTTQELDLDLAFFLLTFRVSFKYL
jgi:hypothetical protein